MSVSTVSFKTTGTGGINLNSSIAISSQRSMNDRKNITPNLDCSSSDEDDSFILPKIKSSNSNYSSRKNINAVTRMSNIRVNPSYNNKCKTQHSTNIQPNKKRNERNNIKFNSDSEYSDAIPNRRITQNKISNQSNITNTLNKNKNKTNTSSKVGRESNLRKSKNRILLHSSDESSSESLRIKNNDFRYEIKNNIISDDSSSGDHKRRYRNTIDTVIESDDSDDIPFLEASTEEPEIDFKSCLKKEETKENENIDENLKTENESIEKVEKIESESTNQPQELKSNENLPQKEKSNDNENENNGIRRTKHYYTSDKHKITKKPKKSKRKIEIDYSESQEEEEKNDKIEKKEKNKIEREKEHQNQNESLPSKFSIENKDVNNDIILNENEEEEKFEAINNSSQNDYETGITDKNEIKRLCSFFMKRLPGYKVHYDLIPYQMLTDTKISFHGKKAKFTLYRGNLPLLTAKVKNKNGSDPIVNIFKFKEKDKEKTKNKSKNKAKPTPIAVVITTSNFTAFSVRKNNSKSENESENIDPLSTIHDSYGLGYGKEIMTVKYTVPRAECAPRHVDVHLFNPPDSIPNDLSNRKPKFTYGSTWILDIGGRVAKRSIKNCILVDESNKEIMSVMKIKDSEVSIEAYPKIGELTVFGFGISSVLCKL